MINYKDWNLKHIGNLFVLSVVFILVISLVQTVVGPLLMKLLPSVFATTITLTDILLFFIFIRLVTTNK